MKSIIYDNFLNTLNLFVRIYSFQIIFANKMTRVQIVIYNLFIPNITRNNSSERWNNNNIIIVYLLLFYYN